MSISSEALINIKERSTTIEKLIFILELSRVHSSEWKQRDFSNKMIRDL